MKMEQFYVLGTYIYITNKLVQGDFTMEMKVFFCMMYQRCLFFADLTEKHGSGAAASGARPWMATRMTISGPDCNVSLIV